MIPADELAEIEARALTWERSVLHEGSDRWEQAAPGEDSEDEESCPLCDGDGYVERQRYDAREALPATVVAYGIGEGLAAAEAWVEHGTADVRELVAEVRLLRGALAAQEARDLAAAQRAGLPPGGCDTSADLADEVLELRALLRECRTALIECVPSPRRADLLARLAALEGVHDVIDS